MTPLNPDQIRTALTLLEGWQFDPTANQLTWKHRFTDFNEALGFIVRVGLLAEQHGHHPEIINVWANLTLNLNTHDAGGKVTQKDVDLAAAINTIL